MEIIRTTSLTKRFGATTAMDNISIHVDEGEIYGFLGLNGAGKTTLIRTVLGMIRPDSGDITLFGKKLTAHFNQWNDIGYLVETPYAYPNLSVLENLKVFYHLRQLKNPRLIPDIIDKLKLHRFADTKARHLSLGNQQRLGLAKAFLHQPRLLILDEPINGLDPEGIVEVRELLRELAADGATVFLSSHILGEISKVAHRIAIIHQGKLIRELGVSALHDQLIRKILVTTNDNTNAVRHLKNGHFQAILNDNNEIEIAGQHAISNPENISRLLVEKGIPPKQVYLYTEDLEMYFLRTIKTEAGWAESYMP